MIKHLNVPYNLPWDEIHRNIALLEFYVLVMSICYGNKTIKIYFEVNVICGCFITGEHWTQYI